MWCVLGSLTCWLSAVEVEEEPSLVAVVARDPTSTLLMCTYLSVRSVLSWALEVLVDLPRVRAATQGMHPG